MCYTIQNNPTEKKPKNRWSFRSRADGTCYWINPKTFVTRKQYPFIKEVRMRVEALRKTLILTAMDKKTLARHKGRNKGKIKKIKNFKIRSKLLLKPEEINPGFKSKRGRKLYKQANQASNDIAFRIIRERLEEFNQELSESSDSDLEEEGEPKEVEIIEDPGDKIHDKSLLFPCQFRFEKKKVIIKNPKASPFLQSIAESDTDESVNLEDVTDFNKIMENHLRKSLDKELNKSDFKRKEFHEKFHTIDKIQNKEIDKRVVELSLNRDANEIKYLIKKRVTDFKKNLGNIKIKLSNLDDELVDPDRSDDEEKAKNYFLKNGPKHHKQKVLTDEEFKAKYANKNKNACLGDKKIMKSAFARFQKKYGVQTEDQILKVISKINNKEVEAKFSKFLRYFRQKQKAKPRIVFAQNTGAQKDNEMLNEINNFVASKDFNHFFENVIKHPKKAHLKNKEKDHEKFNRKPRNVEVMRVSPNNRKKRGQKGIKSYSESKKADSLSPPKGVKKTSSETRSMKKKIAVRLVEFT